MILAAHPAPLSNFSCIFALYFFGSLLVLYYSLPLHDLYMLQLTYAILEGNFVSKH